MFEEEVEMEQAVVELVAMQVMLVVKGGRGSGGHSLYLFSWWRYN